MPRNITPKTASKKLAELQKIAEPSSYEKALIDSYKMITEQETTRLNSIINKNMIQLEQMSQETFKNVYSKLEKGKIVGDTINAMIEQVAINGAPQTAEMLRRTLAKERQRYGIDRVNISMANAPQFLIESINRAIDFKYKNEGQSAVTQLREVIEGSIPTAQEMREMNEEEENELAELIEDTVE